MKIKILDKNEGNELLILDITKGMIKIDSKLIKKDYSYYHNDIKVIEICDNIITYLNEDYQIFIDNI